MEKRRRREIEAKKETVRGKIWEGESKLDHRTTKRQ